MPTVTDATDQGAPAPPSGVDPAARARRIIGSAGSITEGPRIPADSAGLALLEAALDRFDAPVDIRIRGGLGSGRRTLAAALRARRGWRPTVDDLDVLVAPGAPVPAPPDVELVCLRTAPCRHEESWVRRPRRHGLLVVATGFDDDDNTSPSRPHWARRLPAVDARDPAHASVDPVVSFVDRALRRLADIRTARLTADLAELCAHDVVGDLAEAALCALDGPVPR